MKNLSIVIGVTVCVLLFSQSGCKKKRVNNQVKTETNNSGTTTYTYDGEGRLSVIDYYDGLQAKYTYSATQVVRDHYRNNGWVGSVTYNLNAQGYDNGNGTRLYNTEGYLSKSFDGTFYTYYGYANGNQASDTTLNTNGVIREIGTYDYYDKDENRDWGIEFRGKRSKSALKRINRGNDSSDYTYQYDEEGRIVKQTFTNVNGTFTTDYTYWD